MLVCLASKHLNYIFRVNIQHILTYIQYNGFNIDFDGMMLKIYFRKRYQEYVYAKDIKSCKVRLTQDK